MNTRIIYIYISVCEHINMSVGMLDELKIIKQQPSGAQVVMVEDRHLEQV